VSFSALSHLLVTERLRQRAASRGGFSIPAMEERDVPENVEPILSTNMRGDFLMVKRGTLGNARYAFFKCPPALEGAVVTRLFETLGNLASVSGWSNVFGTVLEAVDAMRLTPFAPKTIVIPTPDELPEGVATSIQGLQVVTAPLPQGCGLVATQPTSLGVYTRVGDHLGLQLYNVSRTLMVVRPNGSLG